MHLIVDAFNVLHAWGTGPDSGGFREIETLAGLIRRSRYASGRVSIVCDGAPFPSTDDLTPTFYRTIFAGGGKEADAVIESLISQDTGPRELVVASSDRRLQRAARRRGSRWVTSERFLSQIIRDCAATVSEPLRPAFARVSPLAAHAVESWLEEFDIPADFAGPRAQTPPVADPAPRSDGSRRARTPRSRKSPGPVHDPLLREALEHWKDRLTAEELDMSRWLDEPEQQ